MSDRILQKYGARVVDSAEDDRPAEAEDAENMGCFGWSRGLHIRPISLELRRRTGHILAVNYSYIQKIEFEPATGIILHVSGQIIEIKGRNLNTEIRAGIRLFCGMARFRVPWIQEMDRTSGMQATASATVVEAILW